MKITIRKWHGVGIWHFKTKEEDCGICGQSFEMSCGHVKDCTMPGENCPPAWGLCNHHFHLHCIMRWLNEKSREQDRKCPLCRAKWEFKISDDDDNNNNNRHNNNNNHDHHDHHHHHNNNNNNNDNNNNNNNNNNDNFNEINDEDNDDDNDDNDI